MERATGFEPATLGLEAASTKFRYRSPTFGIRATIWVFSSFGDFVGVRRSGLQFAR